LNIKWSSGTLIDHGYFDNKIFDTMSVAGTIIRHNLDFKVDWENGWW
jgi:hypothetical protein